MGDNLCCVFCLYSVLCISYPYAATETALARAEVGTEGSFGPQTCGVAE
jgi:hypothetical protein